MKEIKAIIQPFAVDRVLMALGHLSDLPGLTLSEVAGWGTERSRNATELGNGAHQFARKTKLEIVVRDELADRIVETIAREAHSGNPGDGKIFVYEVVEVVRIRTGERGAGAL